jgi:D-alanyl-lipoteichoic acid acyltransferase DltB (MBOAT superfamily)
MMGDEKNLDSAALPNGSGAAAVLAAGIGSLMVAVFALLADQISSLKQMMVFYKPTGPLSGVTTCAVVIWLVVWMVLDRRWRKRDVALGRIVTVAVTLLGLSVLLTFPPVADLF